VPWYLVFPALAQALFLDPIEEFGWRGVALPLMQRKYSPFWAGLILGIVWLNRRQMFQKGSGVTEVLYPGD
jgi:membrane protease YdiL (CAAX protease family)